ncbi:hypothetical protein PAMP_004735 [Pampus punctatissimus]
MGFGLVFATLLCFTTWMTFVHTTNGPAASCCIQWSDTRIPVERIMNYTIQDEVICPITAIVFLTKSGKRICSDPNNKWAQKAKNKVDEETKALLRNGQNEEGSTSDTMTPALSTASIKAKQKNGRNEKRRQRKRSRNGRKRQRKCV